MSQSSFKGFFLPIALAMLGAQFVDSQAIAQRLPGKIVGLRVVGGGYGKTEYGPELRAFNWSKGTTIALMMQNKAGGLIEVIEEDSTVTTLLDDKGKSLLDKKSKFSGKAFSLSNSAISKDGKVALFEITTESVPSKGATSIELVGEVHLASGSKVTQAKSDTIKAAKGQKFEVGGLKYSIESAGKPEWGSDPFSIQIKYKGDVGSVKEIKFYSGDGNELDFNDLGTMTLDMGAGMEVSKTIGLPKKIDSIIVGVESWSDRKLMKVPLKVKISLGL